jgi:LysR family transcriptional regulator, glycine cleavage system transcriptional activator
MSVPFRSISVFHSVARAASISKAAAELGVTPSAVSQQIHALETHLGTALLAKAGRRIKLTEAGERYFEMISEKVEQIVDATDQLRGHHALTVLTVRATPTLATKWLLPRLPGFVDQNPQLEVRLDGTNEPTDFNREDVDIEIRHGEGNWPGLFVEGVAQEIFLPVCAPGYAAAKGVRIDEITQYRLIHSVKSQVQWANWLTSAGAKKDKRWQRVLFDRSHMAIDAAVAGMGIALESNLMMWRELRDGTLVCPIADPPPVSLISQWIVCPHDHLRHSKVRAFIAWLKKESEAWAATAAPGNSGQTAERAQIV